MKYTVSMKFAAPKYDETRKCVKCGGSASVGFNFDEELIHRVCKTCGYAWRELPLDRQQEGTKDDDSSLIE